MASPTRAAGTRPTCLVVQHLAPERPYRILAALEGSGVAVELCRVFAGDAIPGAIDGYAGLVVMGGPVSAASDEGFPTRAAEVELLETALAQAVSVLGVCLGAQLLAVAAGGKVYPGSAGPEIGWGPVRLSDDADDDPVLGGLPRQLEVLHWHGDTFDLPAGAVHLASSALYPNQAFRCGPVAWGLQFHLEVDQSAVNAFVEAFGAEAMAAGVAPQEVAGRAPQALARLQPARDRALERWAGLVRGTSAA